MMRLSRIASRISMLLAMAAIAVGLYHDTAPWRFGGWQLLPYLPFLVLLLADRMLFSVSDRANWPWHGFEILASILTAWAGLVLLDSGCGHACGYPLLFVTLANGIIAAIALLVCTILFMRADQSRSA